MQGDVGGGAHNRPARYHALCGPPQIMPLFKLLGRSIAASDFTRNRIKIAASNRRFDISRAKRDLGYKPAVGIPEALRLTVDSFRHLAAGTEAPNSK